MNVLFSKPILIALLVAFAARARSAEPPLTYEAVQTLAAEEFMRLAASSWEAGDARGAVTFALKARRLHRTVSGSTDARAEAIEPMIQTALNLINEDETDPRGRLLTTPNIELERLAEAGDASAAHELGVRHARGLGGLESNPSLAIQWLLRALEISADDKRTGAIGSPGDAEADTDSDESGDAAGAHTDRLRAETLFELGMAMRHRRVRDQLLARWIREESFPDNQPPLGGFDPTEFVAMNEALELGHQGAKAFVAVSLIEQATGDSGAESDDESKEMEERGWRLLRESARDDDPWGQYLLAETLTQGLGIAPNRRLALSWARKSAEQGLREAQSLLAYLIIGSGSSAAGGAEESRLGWTNLLCAAEQNDWRATYDLGLALAEGRGIEADRPAARLWLQKAAAQGHLPAAEALRRFRE